MKIVLSILVLSLFFGCSDQSKKDTEQAEQVQKQVEVKKETPKPKKVEPKKVVKKVEPKKVEVKKVVAKVEKVVAKTKEKVKEISKTISSVTDNKEVQKVTQKITKTLESISLPKTESKVAPDKSVEKKSSTPSKASDLQSMATGLMAGLSGGAVASTAEPKKSSVDGVALFKSKCSSCHGAKAEKKALGKSEIISKWDSKKIADALKGYKAGTFGGSMKAIMQGQAKGLSDEQITALANDIPKL